MNAPATLISFPAADLRRFFADVLPPPMDGEVFVAARLLPKRGTADKPPMLHSYVATHEELASHFAAAVASGGDQYFALARYRPHTTDSGHPGRRGGHVKAVKSFWLDLDCGPGKAKSGEGYATQKEALSALKAVLDTAGLPEPTYLVSSGFGLHIYWCFDHAVSAADWWPVATRFKAVTEAHGLKADPSRTADVASVLRPPGTLNHKSAPPRPVQIIHAGAVFDFAEFARLVGGLASSPPSDHGLPPNILSAPAGTANYGPPDLDKLRSALSALNPDCPEKGWKFFIAALAREAAKYPDFHDQLKALAIAWSKGDLHGRVAVKWPGQEEFEKVWERFIKDDYSKTPVTIGSIYHQARESGWVWTGDFSATDIGNANRFVAHLGGSMRFVFGMRTWLYWSSEENRWIFCKQGEEVEAAKECCQRMRVEAAKIADDDKRKKALAHATKASELKQLTAMVKLSTSDPAVRLTADKLDGDPWLLGVRNGVVNLRTGTMQVARPEHFITKQAGTSFDPQALCPQFMATMQTAFGNDASLVEFFQRLAGSWLFGQLRDQVFSFCHGVGANGKSTLLNAIRSVMGDYAITLPPETLMFGRRDAAAASPDLMMLRGVRLACASETEDGQRLAEARIKQLTGGEMVTARDLHCGYVTFPQTAKLVIVGNHKPQISGTDEGIWRRVQLVPFNVTIPVAQRDPKLPEKLADELPGILAWMVEGCLKWQAQGLQPPAAVTAATNAYKAESDILAEWIGECCNVSPTVFASSTNLYSAYHNWARKNGYYPWTRSKWGRLLGTRFRKGNNASGQVTYLGIDLNQIGLRYCIP